MLRSARELVRWLMADLGLVACQPRPWRITTIQGGGPGPTDLLERDFTAPAPGRRFVGDITYIPTWEGWLYLATVIDVAREINVNEGTLSNWVRLFKDAHPVAEKPLTVSERAQLKALQVEVCELRMKTEFLGKAAAFFAQEYR